MRYQHQDQDQCDGDNDDLVEKNDDDHHDLVEKDGDDHHNRHHDQDDVPRLHDLLSGLMHPDQRTLAQAREHPWVTRDAAAHC